MMLMMIMPFYFFETHFVFDFDYHIELVETRIQEECSLSFNCQLLG